MSAVFRARVLAVSVAASLLVVGPTPASAASPKAAPAPVDVATSAEPCVDEASDLRAALEVATRCDQAVEAVSERTTHTTVTVDPSGTATMRTSVAPERVERDGQWSAIDPTLRQDAAGGLVPVATLADVRLSGGGPGPMVRWAEGGTTFTLGWPLGPLPTPRTDGDTAVYPAVLPGVDLHLTATVDGFSWVLEVKTPAAAANPALRRITYDVGGNARLAEAANGGLTVSEPSGRLFAAAPGAVMWDSSRPAGPEPVAGRAGRSPAGSSPDALMSDARQPGDAATTAPVDVAVAAGDLVVSPDPALLDDAGARFPIFIDPSFNKLATKWAYASSNDENNDTSNARVGLNVETGALYRSYFQFDTSTIRNKTILAAEFQMELDHSYSCGATYLNLFQTSAFSVASGGRISWGALPLGVEANWLDLWGGNAHEGAPCNQPNVTAVFDGADVLEKVRYAATQWSTYHVGLCACTKTGTLESDQDRWKRFETNKSYMVVTFSLPPFKPVATPFTTTADCYKQCASPARVRTTVPVLRFNVGAPYGGDVLTAVEIRTAATETAPIVVPSATFRVTVSTAATSSPVKAAALQVPAGKLANGSTYYWRGTSQNENALWSGWSAWFSFTVDTVAPTLSSVSSVQFPLRQWGATVGTPGTFTFAGTDATDYTWWVDSGTATTSAATSVSHTPAKDMVHTMNVRALDVAGNASATYAYQFWVSPVPNRCWNWRLNETSGTIAADVGNTDANDTVCGPIGSSVTAMPGTMTATGAQWTNDLERGPVVTFDGTGHINTTSAVLDTTKAFTVAAWVKFTNLAADDFQTVVSQAGVNASRFQLQYRKDANGNTGGYCFTMRATDVVGVVPVSACAPQISWPVVQGQWVHVAGVYDPAANTMRVFVMGDLETCGGDTAQAVPPAPWAAGGRFAIGRGTVDVGDTPGWRLRGSVSKVYAHQRALANTEICQMSLQ